MTRIFSRSPSSYLVVFLAGFLSFFFCLISSSAEAGDVNPVDKSIRLSVRDNRTSGLDLGMDFFSTVGDKEMMIPAVFSVPDREARNDTLKALIFTNSITTGTKYLIGRTRPAYYDEGYEYSPFTDPNSSFPSGHATGAFAFATIIAHHYPEYKIPAYTVASLIAVSRIYKDRHWATDVAAGAAVGHFGAKFVLKAW
ncbi:MAG: phosphatase PAP2 family protein [Halanaerobiaceae bacterium]